MSACEEKDQPSRLVIKRRKKQKKKHARAHTHMDVPAALPQHLLEGRVVLHGLQPLPGHPGEGLGLPGAPARATAFLQAGPLARALLLEGLLHLVEVLDLGRPGRRLGRRLLRRARPPVRGALGRLAAELLGELGRDDDHRVLLHRHGVGQVEPRGQEEGRLGPLHEERLAGRLEQRAEVGRWRGGMEWGGGRTSL